MNLHHIFKIITCLRREFIWLWQALATTSLISCNAVQLEMSAKVSCSFGGGSLNSVTTGQKVKLIHFPTALRVYICYIFVTLPCLSLQCEFCEHWDHIPPERPQKRCLVMPLLCKLHAVRDFFVYFVLFTAVSPVPRTVAGPEQRLKKYLLSCVVALTPFWLNIDWRG